MICQNTQGYYDNKNDLYASIGMKGHGAEDIVCGYGSPIQSPLSGYVYSVFDDTHKAADGYWAVYMICEYKGQLGELCIGHPSKLNVSIGQYVNQGDVIAYEGNHGIVYENGKLVTIQEQAAGSQKAHHRHWSWRPLKKSLSFNGSVQALIDYTGRIYRDKDRNCYLILDYNNGYHGLSPKIADILADFESIQFSKALENNLEVPLVEKSRLSKALSSLSDLLNNLLKIITK